MHRSKIIAALMLLLLASITTVSLSGDEPCGPFGDPPAKVNTGFFASAITSHNPVCFGAKVIGPWKDPDGTDRYACLYQPAQVSRANPLPLIVFLHGSLATADSTKLTGLPDLVDKTELGAKTRGFIMIAPEGRYTTHYYPGTDANALGWDNWYRQLNPTGDVTIAGVTYKENLDAAAIDHFISDEIATGNVDTRRIYVMGWSNGAAMALLYALNRPSIAAAAVYSSPDPFGAFNDPCPQTPVNHSPASNSEVQVFNPHAPLMHVRNSCDIGGICPNGNLFASQVRAIGANLDDVILDPDGKKITACDDSCGTDPMAKGEVGASGTARGIAHHIRWPSAYNSAMLDFLKQHSLASGK
jgi:predicted esterase